MLNYVHAGFGLYNNKRVNITKVKRVTAVFCLLTWVTGLRAGQVEQNAKDFSLCEGIKVIINNIHTKFATDTASLKHSLNGDFEYALFNKTNPRIQNFQCCRTRNVSTKRYICIYCNIHFNAKAEAMKKIADLSAGMHQCTSQYPMKGNVDGVEEVTFYLPDDNIELTMQCVLLAGVYEVQILVADGNL